MVYKDGSQRITEEDRGLIARKAYGWNTGQGLMDIGTWDGVLEF